MRNESVIETQKHRCEKSLCKGIDLSLRQYCDYVRYWASQQSSRCAFEDLTALSWRPHSVSPASLSKRRATARTLCMLKVCAVALRSKMFMALA